MARQTILNVAALLFAWGLILGLFAGALGYISASSEPRPLLIMALPDEPVALEVARVEASHEPPATAEPPEEPARATPETSAPAEPEVVATAPVEEPAVAEEAPSEDDPAAAEPPPAETESEPESVVLAVTTTPTPEVSEPAGTAQVASVPAAQPTIAVETDDPSQPAWRRHGESVEAAVGLPRIAVVIAGLGLSAASSEAAIRQLPSNVTLSFTPYSRRLDHWISLARANRHEVLLDLPMEPTSFPNDDPGPKALLTGLSEEENLDRLDWVLGRGTRVVGVAASMGSRFTASDAHMLPVVQTLVERGLLYLDNRSTNRSVAELLSRHYGMPYVAASRVLDSDQASRIAINARLAEVERLAIEQGFATAIGQPYPVTIERVRDWSAGLAGRGIALVPISALVGADRPPQLSADQ